MLRYGPVDHLPENFGHFVDELAPGVGALYGAAAEQDYRAKARRSMAASIVHPAVRAVGATERGTLIGLALAIERRPMAEVALVHVLASHAGRGVEDRLVDAAVQALHASNAKGVVCEYIPATHVALGNAFARLGFETIARQLMCCDTNALRGRRVAVPAVDPLTPAHWRDAAECIVDAYAGHPGRRLHGEVQDRAHAQEYIARVAAGNYGVIAPGYLVVARSDDACKGVGLGCQIAPGTGFILQLAVRRAVQGRGVGSAILRAQARSFEAHGLDRIYLGVTLDNPARLRYEHLGFRRHCLVDAYVHWKHAD